MLELVNKEVIIGKVKEETYYFEKKGKVYQMINGDITPIKEAYETLGDITYYLGKRRTFFDKETNTHAIIELSRVKMWNDYSSIVLTYKDSGYTWENWQRFMELLKQQETLNTLQSLLNTNPNDETLELIINPTVLVGNNISRDLSKLTDLIYKFKRLC